MTANDLGQCESVGVSTLVSWALLLVSLSTLGCSSEVPQAAEKAKTGGMTLAIVTPPEAKALWPLPSGWRLVITRARSVAGAGAETALDTEDPAEKPRVEAFAGGVTVLSLVWQDADGALRAKAVTGPAIVEPTTPDREVAVFVAPAGVDARVVTVVAADGEAVAHPGRLGEAVAVVNSGEVYVSGGAAHAGGDPCAGGTTGVPTAAAWRFDPADHTFTALPAMAQPRAYHTASVLPGGTVAWLGGQTSADGGAGKSPATTASVDLLRANQGTVSAAPVGLSQPRGKHCAVVVEGKVVVAGGVGPGAKTIELWDPGLGTLATGTLLQPRSGHRCAYLTDPVSEERTVWLLGGTTQSGAGVPVAVNTIEVWAIDGSKLLSKGTLQMPSGPVSHLAGAVIQSPLGIAIAGGLGGSGGTTPSTEVWFRGLPGAKWTAGGALTVGRACAATVQVGPRLILGGGMTASGLPDATVDIVDFAGVTPKVVANRELALPLAGAAASSMGNGGVLFTGGVALDDKKLVAADRLSWMWP